MRTSVRHRTPLATVDLLRGSIDWLLRSIRPVARELFVPATVWIALQVAVETTEVGGGILIWIASLALLAVIGVRVQRMVVLGHGSRAGRRTDPGGRFHEEADARPACSERETRFMNWLVVFALVLVAALLFITVATSSAILFPVLVLLALTLFARFGLVFPGAAVGGESTLQGAFVLSKRNGVRIGLALTPPLMAWLVLNQVEIWGSVSWEATRSGLILLSWIVGMTVLAEAYRQVEFSRRV